MNRARNAVARTRTIRAGAERKADADIASEDTSASVTRRATVPDALAGMRADRAATTLFDDFSRSRITAWIKAGVLTFDGAKREPSDAVIGGEVLALEATLVDETRSKPEAIALELLLEDKQFLVVNKPAGLIVHPGAGNPAGTLENALLNFDPALVKVPRAGIVHRLDKDTSGALIIARTLAAHAALVAELAEREIERRYAAVVLGSLVAGGTVAAALGRHPHDRLRQAVRDEAIGGRRAVTHYRVRERFRAHTFVNCQLETGRTHQIRVHMAHIRHPLVGDPVYGGGLKVPKGATPELDAALRVFKRQALHAESVAFTDPKRGTRVEASAPLPDDFEALLAALRADSAALKG